MGTWRVRLAVLLAAALLLTSATAGHASLDPPPLPSIGAARVVDQNDVADPSILTVGSTYYRFGTTDWQSNVPTASSTNLVDWQYLPDSYPTLPSWAAPSISMTWAPSVIAVGGRYLMYVATEEAASGRECISLATATSPAGPYTDSSAQPFLCQRSLGGSIDPDAVRAPDGSLHLVWKNDGNCCSLPTELWEQDVSPDGSRLTGAPHVLMRADEAWQDGNIEGPDMVPAAKGWWLLYSGGSWRTANYATGIAWCATIAGPCRDALGRPLLPSTPTMRTPSGLSTFRDASGRLWAAFTTTVLIPSHRHRTHYYSNRVLDIAPIAGG